MKIIFLGTPDFAIPSLKALAGSKHKVIAVITQPDRPSGRGEKCEKPPVKKQAEKLGIPVYQFQNLRAEAPEKIRELNPDIMVTCAYGQIISREILDIPYYGVINVHGSLLPKYRGASPIQHSILNGDTETGITIMQTAEGMDTGDILYTEKTPIDNDETAGELFDRLSVLGSGALLHALDLIESGKAVRLPQDERKASKVKMIRKQDAEIEWTKSAAHVRNLIRGMNPWPVAFTYCEDLLLKIYSAEVISGRGKPGEILCASGGKPLTVAAGEGALRILEMQTSGGRRMPSSDFLKGHLMREGTLLGRIH